MRNPTVTGLLQNLEKKKLIERIQNPDDSRSKVIRLTDKVFNMENELTSIGDTLEVQFTQRLDEQDKEQMKYLVKKNAWEIMPTMRRLTVRCLRM